METGGRKIWGLDPNIFFLGVVSLLTDISSEMIFTLLPLFLANVIGATATIIGVVGGISDSTDALVRIFSGWVSDRVGRRKLLAGLGYGLSTLVKPLMYIAASPWSVLIIRFGDRVGKGVRASPRDALLANSLQPWERGRGFGLHRAMDSAGAVIGLALAVLIIYLVQRGGIELTFSAYRWLVLVGIVPAVISLIVLITSVREKSPTPSVNPAGSLPRPSSLRFSRRFKLFLVVIAIFTLGNSSDFFVVLRAQNLGSPLLQVTAMLVLFNIIYTGVAMPAGVLSDRLGRRGVIILGWLIYALVYLGFGAASSLWQVWLLFAIYGVYYGIVEGVARAFVADLVPEESRGTAYGLYHGTVGLMLLPASLIAGWLWDLVSPAAPFYFGAVMAFLAGVGILLLVKERPSTQEQVIQ